MKPQQIQYCKNCDQPVVGHRMCPSCGFYKGREILSLGQKDE
ncbi:MAG: 50S ribosomal protein L32 [Planctomycetota bacterium]